MEELWNRVEAYFGEDRVLQFHHHLCTMSPSPIHMGNSNSVYGVQLGEDVMPAFTTLGQTHRAACSCAVLKQVQRYIATTVTTTAATTSSSTSSSSPPSSTPRDYAIVTRKGDTSVEEACQYAMRDTLQWWSCWKGSLDRHDYWKHLYVAFSTIADDVLIPPVDLVSGRFRFLGHSMGEIMAGLQHEEDVSADGVAYMTHCLIREYLLQYLEKTDPGIREMLLGHTSAMTQFRVFTANNFGAAVCVLTSSGIAFPGVGDLAVEMSGVGDALSMDMGKEALGVLQSEPAESTVSGVGVGAGAGAGGASGAAREQDRNRQMQELRWMYARSLEQLDRCPTASLLRPYATSGYYFVPLMDRYRERVRYVRVSLRPAQWEMLRPYVKVPGTAGENAAKPLQGDAARLVV